MAHELDCLREQRRENLVTEHDNNEKVKQLQLELHTSRTHARQVEHEIAEMSLNAKYFQKSAAKSDKVLKEALLVLQELSSKLQGSLCEESVESADQREF
jgi:hypothetical protein